MFSNLRPSQNVAVAGKIAPISQGAGSVSTGWIDMAQFQWVMAIIKAGVMGASGTIDAIFQQATDSGGTGAKAVTGAAATQLVKATDDNREAILELREDALDLANNFRFVRLTVTVATAASLIDATVIGLIGRAGPMNLRNLTTVKGIVSVPSSV
jgi:hypothetical protein